MPKKTEKQADMSDFDCIVALTDAEKRAKKILEQARKRRTQLLKKAKEDSEAEVDAYRKSCEEKMIRLQQDYSGRKDLIVSMFSKETSERHRELRRMYEISYKSVLVNILEKILKPEPEFHENLKL